MDFVRFNAPSHPALMVYASAVNTEADIAHCPPCLLAAIMWRETGGTNELEIGVPPGPGCGVGLCQITSNVTWSSLSDPTYDGYHILTKPADNLYVAAAYYITPNLANAARAQRDNPAAFALACEGQEVMAVAAAYNGGWGIVQRAMDRSVSVDRFDTNGYGADVLRKYITLVSESHA
ncbi:MAG: transglycosylase SLT domain-containing protein [Candidatus Tyrphobacter sp.]